MRRIPALLALGLTLAACQLNLPSGSTGTTSTGADTSSTSTTGAGGSTVTHPCDDKNDCGACQGCSVNVQCAKLYAACAQSSSCQGIDQCFAGCGNDAACQEQCYLLGPDGETTYRALRSCIFCDACPSDCAGYMICK
jgi:hypothetical protein